jgi:hypothetical protein
LTEIYIDLICLCFENYETLLRWWSLKQKYIIPYINMNLFFNMFRAVVYRFSLNIISRYICNYSTCSYWFYNLVSLSTLNNHLNSIQQYHYSLDNDIINCNLKQLPCVIIITVNGDQNVSFWSPFYKIS